MAKLSGKLTWTHPIGVGGMEAGGGVLPVHNAQSFHIQKYVINMLKKVQFHLKADLGRNSSAQTVIQHHGNHTSHIKSNCKHAVGTLCAIRRPKREVCMKAPVVGNMVR